MSQSLIPIILAGGKGERFWPLSRRDRPKQFLSLDGSGISLLQATANRLLSVAGDWNSMWVITNAQIVEGVRQQLPELPPENLLIEPEGRDTAAAVAWATLEVSKRLGKDAVLGFFPADHWIEDQGMFEQTLHAATEFATTQPAIVTLSIHPDAPATGYGYIEQGEKVSMVAGLPVFRVNRFREKPNRETAEYFLQQGGFSWNSGMFIFRAGVVLEEFRRYAPNIIELLETKGEQAYGQLEKKSIDYALMEKTQLAYVLPAQFGWDDVGDWKALARLYPLKGTNVELATHIQQDTSGAIIYSSEEEEVIVTIGLEDVVIVRDRNVTLVVQKDRTQDIKKILQQLQLNPKLENLL